MVKTQLWSPDSCGCIFHEKYEDGNYENTIQLDEAVLLCDDHNTITPVQAYQLARFESKLKDNVIKELIDNNALPLTIISSIESFDEYSNTVSTTNHLHVNVKYKYYFRNNPERTLVFSLEGIDKFGSPVKFDNNHKGSIMTILNSKIGVGKCLMKDLITVGTDDEYKRAITMKTKRNESYVDRTSKFRAPNESEKEKEDLKKKIMSFFNS